MPAVDRMSNDLMTDSVVPNLHREVLLIAQLFQEVTQVVLVSNAVAFSRVVLIHSFVEES